MVKQFTGKRYSVEIRAEPFAGKYICNLVAIHLRSGLYSTINTLNTVLSLFEIEENDPRAQDADWLLNAKEYRSFENIASNFLSDKKALAYLECKLDEDRACGEWANRAV